MFLDIATIFVKAGNGGDGVVSFHTEKYVSQGGPDGGDGGNGGSIVFVIGGGSSTLVDFKYKKHFRAENGANGASNKCTGKCGKDTVIEVPRGTVIKDKKSGRIIRDMFDENDKFVLVKGGAGGKGNARFATAQRKAPAFCQQGEQIKEIELVLELKTVADVGLVGFPNVGKSTFLSATTGAHPKIANYHFTTLNPNLGVVSRYGETFVLADIPGLIEGAAKGMGLGHNFLRHIERVRVIIHVVDITGMEGRDPYEDYLIINNELKSYSDKLASLPQLVCANKCDCLSGTDAITRLEEKIGRKVYAVSAMTKQNVDELIGDIFKLLKTLPPAEPLEYEPFEYEKEDGKEFTTRRTDDGAFIVEGGLINRLLRNVLLDDIDSFSYFQKTLRECGVIKQLKKTGAKDGDTVRIGEIEFDFVE